MLSTAAVTKYVMHIVKVYFNKYSKLVLEKTLNCIRDVWFFITKNFLRTPSP